MHQTKQWRLTAISTALLGISLFGPAYAADNAAANNASDTAAASKDGTQQVETVTVTAQRRSQQIQKVPIAVTAIGGKDLDSNSIQIANDVVKYVPNFNADSTEGRERPRWFLRGIGNNDPSNLSLSPIAVYVDDVYWNNVFAQGFPLFDLQRIEVLRGPQGTLWGKNTTGGAINYISRKPNFGAANGYADISYGSFADRKVEGAIGGAIYGDTLAGRVSFFNEQNDGYIDNTYSGQKVGSLRDTAVRAQLLLAVGETSDWLLNTHYRDYSGGGSFWHLDGTNNGKNQYGYQPPSDPYTVSENVAQNDKITSNGVDLTGHVDLGRLTLTSITALENAHRTFVSDGDGSPLEISRGYSKLDTRQISEELRLASPAEDQLSWIAGAHAFKEDLNSVATSGTLPGGPAATAYQQTSIGQQTKSFAIFGNATYRFTDRFRVTGGLRWTTEKKSIDLVGINGTGSVGFQSLDYWYLANQLTGATKVNATQNESHTWSAPTWDLTPSYSLTDNIETYFRYARGFRSGGYNGGATTQAAVNTVTPEYLTDYELGVKSQWLDNRLIANLSVFRYDYKDMQVFAIAPTASGQTVQTLSNAARGKVDGVELELKAVPVNGLTLSGNAGYLYTEYTDFPTYVNGAATNLSGHAFPRSPKLTVGVGANYRIPVSSGHVELGTLWNYKAKEYFNAIYQNDAMAQAGYTTGDLEAAWHGKDDKLVVTAFVRNVTDKQYRTLAVVPTYGAYEYIYSQPRFYGAEVAVKF
ncbi:TonB-dependent receptor [Amantichitinum ursilacus]|uniref:Pesticin receptor n=1 Tax=Amantichitinum ursilacus TaxID=857265 RepID=A0A0N0GL11_9NEIS|nr:TonB-dependent receptor [Amantichitinum ursilacus]KPC49614.1 Pesticin receptor precursor [Amantichitinum ursilacus]